MKTLRVKSLVPFLICALRLSQPGLWAEETRAVDYLSSSDYWPESVALVQPVVSPTDETLQEGRRGVFIRAEEDVILVDFGRYGLMRLDPDVTDFYEQAKTVVPGSREEDGGLFSSLISRSFFDPETRLQCTPGQYDTGRYYAIAYADIGGLQWENFSQLIAGMSQNSVVDPVCRVQPLIVPLDATKDEMDADMEANPPTAPTMMYFLSKGYQHAWAHHPEKWPVVIVDRNGYVITRISWAGLENAEAAETKIRKEVLNYEQQHPVPVL